MLVDFIKNWKFAAIGVCIILALTAALWVQTERVHTYKTEVDALKSQNTSLTNDLTDAKTKIATFEKAALDQQEAMAVAEVERQRRIAVLSAQISALRKKQPPKECSAAVEWAIENKGDIGW